jgi:hypothetical protein
MKEPTSQPGQITDLEIAYNGWPKMAMTLLSDEVIDKFKILAAEEDKAWEGKTKTIADKHRLNKEFFDEIKQHFYYIPGKKLYIVKPEFAKQ